MPLKYPRHWKRGVCISVPILLIGLRVALPWILKSYVNHVLDRDPAYDGFVTDIDVALIRGAYTIKGIEIVKTSGDIPVPFFAGEAIDISVKWRALRQGALVGEIDFVRPRINFVNGRSDAERQGGTEVDWRKQIRDLFPLRIDRLTVSGGEIHYADFSRTPDIDVFLSDLEVVAENLTNSLDVAETLLATVDITGTAMNVGSVKAHADLDPYADLPTFDLDAQVTGFDLTRLNALLKTYGRFDLESGKADIFAEMATRDGQVHGYVKPVLHDVKVVKLNKDLRESGPVVTAWETFVGAIKGVLQNDKTGAVAMRVPISGSLTAPDTLPWVAAVSAIRNALVAALFHGLDGDITMADAPSGSPQDARAEARSERAAAAKDARSTRQEEKAARKEERGAPATKDD